MRKQEVHLFTWQGQCNLEIELANALHKWGLIDDGGGTFAGKYQNCL